MQDLCAIFTRVYVRACCCWWLLSSAVGAKWVCVAYARTTLGQKVAAETTYRAHKPTLPTPQPHSDNTPLLSTPRPHPLFSHTETERLERSRSTPLVRLFVVTGTFGHFRGGYKPTDLPNACLPFVSTKQAALGVSVCATGWRMALRPPTLATRYPVPQRHTPRSFYQRTSIYQSTNYTYVRACSTFITDSVHVNTQTGWHVRRASESRGPKRYRRGGTRAFSLHARC